MKNFKLRLILVGLIILIYGCTTHKKAAIDDEFATESVSSDSSDLSSQDSGASSDSELSLDEPTSKQASSDSNSNEKDEFAEFDAPVTPQTVASKSSPEDDLEKELNSLDNPNTQNSQAQSAPQAELSLDEPVTSQVANQSVPAEIAQNNFDNSMNMQEPPAPQVVQNPVILPEVSMQSAPQAEVPPAPAPIAPAAPGEINSVQYQANKSGGTIVINADQPLQFTTRSNPATHQLIVEVQNSVVPKKLKRSLNTKDMASSIGSVDIYQKPNSSVARFVVQLRPGAPEPLVQPEGTSLLIVGAANPSYVKRNETDPAAGAYADSGVYNSGATQTQETNPDLSSEGIMNAQSLEDFLASNNKFYGKKISIEAINLDINDAFKFLAEESGVNLIVDDGVRGNVSLKLRQVPWDQAFVLILKSKKLGYKRQGNVIRVAEIANLQKEEDDAIKLQEARKGIEPLAVKRFFIGYADISDMEKKIKDFISTNILTSTGTIATAPARGKVISDTRTSSLIVTETPENLSKIEKLIAALDTQPKQVLIEGKIVEAKESFTKGLGVVWGSPAAGVADAAPDNNFIRPTLKFDPGLGGGLFTPSFGLGKVGRPGDLGNLTASLNLGEKESRLRVLSSPRISVLSNQTANISQTVNVLIDKVSITTAGSAQTTVTKEIVPVGVSLKVTPQVSNEGTVVMDLDIERSFPGSASTSAIEKRNAKTKVIVRSGQTAVIGGIFTADQGDDQNGIPFFKDIPIFGTLFKGSQSTKSKNELVIFVTPRIQKMVQGDAPQSTSL